MSGTMILCTCILWSLRHLLGAISQSAVSQFAHLSDKHYRKSRKITLPVNQPRSRQIYGFFSIGKLICIHHSADQCDMMQCGEI